MANQEEEAGMKELENVRGFEDNIFNLNEAIGLKKKECDKHYSWNSRINKCILVLRLAQLVLAIYGISFSNKSHRKNSSE